MKAIYKYLHTDYKGGFTYHEMPVEVIGENGKSYRVRFLEYHANGTRPGHETWVRKQNVSNVLPSQKPVQTQMQFID